MPMSQSLLRPAEADGPGPNTLLLMRYDANTSAGLLTDSSRYRRQLVYLSGTMAPGGMSKFGNTLFGQNSAIPVGVMGFPLGAGRNTLPNLGNFAHTIECWVYIDAADYGMFNCTIMHLPTTENLTSTQGQHLYIGGYHIYWNDGVTSVCTTETHDAINPTPFPYDQWFHLAAVQTGGCKRIFVDGQLRAVAFQPPPQGTCGLSIGGYAYDPGGGVQYYNVHEGFTMYIDDLRLSSRSLYTSNFTPPTAPFNRDTAGVAYQPCVLPAGFLMYYDCNGNGDLVAVMADGAGGQTTVVVTPGGCL